MLSVVVTVECPRIRATSSAGIPMCNRNEAELRRAGRQIGSWAAQPPPRPVESPWRSWSAAAVAGSAHAPPAAVRALVCAQLGEDQLRLVRPAFRGQPGLGLVRLQPAQRVQRHLGQTDGALAGAGAPTVLARQSSNSANEIDSSSRTAPGCPLSTAATSVRASAPIRVT